MGPTIIEINKTHLLNNFKLVKNSVYPAKVMAIVKANAYGHDILKVSKLLVENNVDYLGVGFYEEGIQIRECGIKTPILVLGAHQVYFIERLLDYDLDMTLTHADQLTYLEKLCKEKKKKARVHIKIDTGMNRMGFYEDEFMHIAEKVHKSEWIDFIGIYSHLSSADEDNPEYTLMQINHLKKIEQYIKTSYSKNIIFHLANTAAIVNYPQANFDMVRPGNILYGNPPSHLFKINWDVKQVMRFKSQIALIKSVNKNEPIGYSRRYYTTEKTKIAIVPVGYADGYNRKLTNNADVLIGGRRYPVVGTVCMDLIMINIGIDSTARIGDEVVLFGNQGAEHISVTEISQRLDTLPYEVTCWPSSRVQRVFI
jgi:alanine racemase